MKQKALFLIHLPPPEHGAAVAGSYLRDSEAVTETFESHFINISTSLKLKNIGCWSLAKLVRYVGVWKRLFRYLAKEGRPSVILVTPAVRGAGLLKELPLLWFISRLKRPIVVQFHNKGLSGCLTSHPALARFVKYLFNRPEVHAIIVSKRLSSDINNYIMSENIHIVPYGIPKIGTEYMNQSRTGKRIIFLGNLIVAKGLYDFLESCRMLKDRGIDFEANIVGGEAEIDRKELELEILKRNITEKCKYIGALYGNDKYVALGSADIFVFPTFYKYETFGLVNVEAMACGLPVISTDEGGIPDIVDNGETGFIVPKGNPEEIANKLELLLKDDDLRVSMGSQGRRKYLDQFTVDRYIAGIINVMHACAKEAER